MIPAPIVSRQRRVSAILAAVALSLVGCVASTPDVEVSDGTGATQVIRWTTDTDAACRLTVEGDAWTRSWDTRGNTHAVTVLGLAADTDYTWSVECDAVVVEGRGRTPAAPAMLPEATVSDVPLFEDDGLLGISIVGEPDAAFLLDGRGRYAWWSIGSDDDAIVPRARLSRDGNAVLHVVYDLDDAGTVGARGAVERIPLDGSATTSWDLEDVHHDFVELPDGGLAWIAYDIREPGGYRIWGDRILEQDAAGNVRTVWSAWDHLTYDPDTDYGPKPWTHANSIEYVESEDAYLLSLYSLGTIYLIDRATGAERWSLGTAGSIRPEVPFSFQHQPSLTERGIALFSNGDTDLSDSFAVEYALDGTDTAPVVWLRHPDPAVFSPTFGDAERLPSGDTIVSWAMGSRLERVDPDGVPVSSWELRSGIILGFGSFVPFPGPAEPSAARSDPGR